MPNLIRLLWLGHLTNRRASRQPVGEVRSGSWETKELVSAVSLGGVANRWGWQEESAVAKLANRHSRVGNQEMYRRDRS
jgi:hypothetical protein